MNTISSLPKANTYDKDVMILHNDYWTSVLYFCAFSFRIDFWKYKNLDSKSKAIWIAEGVEVSFLRLPNTNV